MVISICFANNFYWLLIEPSIKSHHVWHVEAHRFLSIVTPSGHKLTWPQVNFQLSLSMRYAAYYRSFDEELCTGTRYTNINSTNVSLTSRRFKWYVFSMTFSCMVTLTLRQIFNLIFPGHSWLVPNHFWRDKYNESEINGVPLLFWKRHTVKTSSS